MIVDKLPTLPASLAFPFSATLLLSSISKQVWEQCTISQAKSPLCMRSLMLLEQCQWKTSQNTDVNGVENCAKIKSDSKALIF